MHLQWKYLQPLIFLAIVLGAVLAVLYFCNLYPFSRPLGYYQFEVIDGPLLVRTAPSGDAVAEMAVGERFLPDLSQQLVMDGFVWIKHDGGYSALHRIDGSERYVDIVITAPDEPMPKRDTNNQDAPSEDAAA